SAVQESLFRADGTRYRLLEWCVMPNHVHVLVQTNEGMSLGEIVRTWKTYTAKVINVIEGTTGSIWETDYHDRYIRDLDHLENARLYIRKNPVKAGLCIVPEAWRWSSAFPFQK
ncbi:MAG TPA: transposase, partial [Haloferula sp.]